MILEALVRLYDKKIEQARQDPQNENPQIAPPGWSKAKVVYGIELDEEGHVLGAVSLKKQVTRGKTTKEVPAEMLVPEQKKRSSGVSPNFLCDTSDYILGLTNKGKNEKEKEKSAKRARKCFSASSQLHHEILEGRDVPAARAVLRFFDHWQINDFDRMRTLSAVKEDLLGGGNIVFLWHGKPVQKDAAIRQIWETWCGRGNEEKAHKGQCLVMGEEAVPIALIHPNIKGVRGALSSGAAIVSFNTPSLESFGHEGEQGKNAPVSEKAAFAYTAALNELLADREYTQVIGDTTVVYWAETARREEQDIFSCLLGGDPQPELQQAVHNLCRGLSANISGISISPEEPFYILGLSPNAARLSVRFFMVNTLGNFVKDMEAHQERMAIQRPSYEQKKPVTLRELLQTTARKVDRNPLPPPYLTGDLLRAVLTDSAYPETLFQNVLLRIRAEKNVDYIRAGLIKAYLIKNHANSWEGEIQMAVNESCKAPAYVLGRLFALLENIQKAANPGINATIKDRYFNSACATPASIFPTLLKLSNAHLRKLEEGRRIFFSKKLGALMEKISMPDTGLPLPSRLTLEEQGAFIVGYYQETQAHFAKKEDN